MTEDPYAPERIVKPRHRSTEFLPIIAIAHEDGQVLYERTGEVLPLVEFAHRLPSEPRSLVIVQNAADFLADLDEQLSHLDSWQFRVTPVVREINRPERGKVVRVGEVIVAFFGFRGRNKQVGRYFYPLDPYLWAKRGIHHLRPGDDPRILKLLAWGQDVREWCNSQELRPRPTVGGLAAQLLRDPRFYPQARRKVPKVTNARARFVLPGNFYELYCDTSQTRDAVYLDMKSAHHNAAMDLRFPCANHLYARGNFHVTDETVVTVSDELAWHRVGTPMFEAVLRHHGLFLLHLTVPYLPAEKFPPPFAKQPGRHARWVYSNELPMLRELGIVVDAIVAAWTSPVADQGLNRYAQWALTEIATASPERRLWQKPALLATYGVLAARPRVQEYGYKHAKGGEVRRYPVGENGLEVMAKRSLTENETSIVNVIHRGMIEAETRLRCLSMARYLHGHGCEVLGIYADAIFARGDSFPLLPAPWAFKADLHRLRFFNSTSFTSAEMTKLPGIPVEGLESLARIERIRRLNAHGIGDRW